MKRPRIRRSIVLLAVAVAVPLFACGGHADDEIDTSGIVPVSVVEVRRGTIRAVVTATAVVKPATAAELVVVPPQSARIAELPVGVGDRVRRGGLLVRFDIPALASELAAAESAVRSAQAAVDSTRPAFERESHLFERGIAAGKDVDTARRELADAESGLDASRSALAAAKTREAQTLIRAPFDGVVVARTHNPGDQVDPQAAEPILRFVDPAHLQVEAMVPVDDLARIRAGAPARVIGPRSFAPEEASVLAVPGAVDPATGIAIVRLSFTSTSALPSGTPVRVEIGTAQRADTLVVPFSAVIREADDAFVFTVDNDGVAHRTKVSVGVVAEPEVEVLSGVDAGERVIATGAAGLPDGAKVAIRE